MFTQPRATRRMSALLAVATTVASLAALVVMASSPAGASPAKGAHLRVCATSNKVRWVHYQVSRSSFARTVWVKTRPNHPVCSNLAVKSGSYSVRQIRSRGTHVTAIHASRLAARSAARPAVRVHVGAGSTTVLFRNHSRTAAPAAPSAKAQASTGYVEVCKRAGDQWVRGSVTITVTGGSQTYTQVVPVGQCTAPLAVPAGTATVSEVAPFPYFLRAVRTQPKSYLLSIDRAHSSATVKVVASPDGSQETLVNLINRTKTGYFKVCKVLGSNAQDVINSGNNTFYFDASYQRPGSPWVTYGTIPVTVPSLNQAACSLSDRLPLDAHVKVTEEAAPATSLAGITIQPAANDLGSSGRTAYFKMGATRGSVVTATFTNTALGTIEICKDMVDTSYYGTPFQFSVNSGAPITVRAGHCSAPIPVPAGTATVQELPKPDFQLVGWTATGPNGDNRLLSSATSNPVTVSAPYGGVGNETVVTAKNDVLHAQFKICKMIDSSVPVGKSYTFHAETQSGNATYTEDVTLTPTAAGPAGEDCSLFSMPFPVVLPNGTRTTTKVTEGPSPFGLTSDGKLIVEPTSATYEGNGQQGATRVWQPGDPGSMDGQYYTSATLGYGANVFTFTNSLVLDP